jgi:hypothetical protein
LRREVPVFLGSAVGVIILAAYFIVSKPLSALSSEIMSWGVIMSAFALCLASVNLVRKHVTQIARRDQLAPFSLALLIAFFGITIAGLFRGSNSAEFTFFYKGILEPVSSSLYGMLAFYLLSAAFRTFRARSLEATFLLVSAVLVMLGRATIGSLIWEGFPGLAEWFLGTPNAAADRGVIIGAALGLLSSGVRLMLGIDRAYLGSEE